MGQKKSRHHSKNSRKLKKLVDEVIARQQKTETKEILKEKKDQFNLSQTDRITYIYKKNKLNVICEVTCVSYDILIENDWQTVVYYDNFHGGILHRHSKFQLNKDNEIINTFGVKTHGTPHQLLTWAVKDIRSRYTDYHRGFVKANRSYLKKKSIDIY